MQNVCLLGATGSVGKSALEVLALYPEKFRLFSVAAHSNVQKLADIAVRFNVRRVGIADVAKTDELARLLKEAGRGDIEILSGPEAAVKLAADKEAQTVIVAVVGAAGVPATFAAAKAGKRILHANKESVVCGGAFLQQTVHENGAVMLPVDSEHNAIFQCLAGASEEDRGQCRLWLTCSGGPFRDRPELDLNTVTPAMALAHPTWQMGRKISIDSATLMNKGLEVIEARWLFDIPQDRIHVVIHPQSVVHSMVEYGDGSFIAQLGTASMKHPVAYCLGWPERLPAETQRLDPFALSQLTFREPDVERFVQLGFAYDALREGGTASIVLNAANEIGVEAFLNERISFTGIAEVCRRTMQALFEPKTPASVDEILSVDAAARREASLLLPKLA